MRREVINIPENKSEFHKINNIRLPVLLISKDTTILEVNESLKEVLGYSKEDLYNKSLLDITDPKDRAQEVNNFIDLFYGNKKESSLLKQLISKDNQTVQFLQYTSAIREENGETRLAAIYLVPFRENLPGKSLAITPLLKKLKTITEFFDHSEFGSAYNAEVLSKIRNTIDEIERNPDHQNNSQPQGKIG